MRPLLESIFEEQIEFRLKSGVPIDGSVYIGETEFLPVETLKDDSDAYSTEFSRWLSDEFIPAQEAALEAILKINTNKQRFADLCTRCAAGNVAPLVGSGMSVPCGKKMWSAFLERLRQDSTLAKADLDAMLAKGLYEEAAEAVAAAMPGRLFDKTIEHELRLEQDDQVFGAVRLLPGLFPLLALTTNLDDVLERRYTECGGGFKRIHAGKEIGQYRRDGDGPALLKLHGDCYRAETRVLRKAEYEAAYGPAGELRAELAKVYETKSLLCIGCSLAEDRTMALIHEVAKRDNKMPMHFAFMPLPKDDATRVARDHFLAERNIFTIWYDGDHDECLTTLLFGMLRRLGKV
jgi:hypothetical protein